jgi:hypothetical protein
MKCCPERVSLTLWALLRREQFAVTILPFKPIKVKTPRGASHPFPREIRSISAAKDFVKMHVESDPAKRTQQHWALAISALEAATHASGSYAHARSAMHHALDVEGWLAD